MTATRVRRLRLQYFSPGNWFSNEHQHYARAYDAYLGFYFSSTDSGPWITRSRFETARAARTVRNKLYTAATIGRDYAPRKAAGHVRRHRQVRAERDKTLIFRTRTRAWQ